VTSVDASIETTIRGALQELAEFVKTPPFRQLLGEMSTVPANQRHKFVQTVILSDAALAARGVVPPPGVVLQRSAFADDRPTLFCISKYLPKGVVWDKVTITFDNPSGPPAMKFDEATKKP
jgi:hypothetical protein